MAISVSVTGIEEVIEKLRTLPEKVAKPSFKKGLARAGSSGKTLGAKLITTVYKVSSGRVKRDINVKKSGDSLQIIFAGGVINLVNFNPSQNKTGIRVTIKRGSPKIIKGAFKAGKFIAIRGTRSAGFHRNSPRLPITALSTVSVGTMAGNEGVIEPLVERVGEQFVKTVEAAIAFNLGKL